MLTFYIQIKNMPTALITGASKGIGKAIAEKLAAKKTDLLLIARTENLLKELAENLRSKYTVQVYYFVVDLSKPDAVEKIMQWCANKTSEINILVNNAGYGLSGAFEKYSIQEQIDMMQVNMRVPVQLIHALLPSLHKQDQSYIVNIASNAAYQSVPGLSLYAASKAFVLSFSRGLRYELRNSAVSVTAICPGATDTDFPKRAMVSAKATKAAAKVNMSADAVATIAVEAMFAKKAEVIAGFINKLSAFLVWLLPKKAAEKIAADIYGL